MFCVHVVHPCSSIVTTATWKKLRFILSARSDFHITDSLLLAAHAFARHVFISIYVDETLLPRLNLSTDFREVPFIVEMSLLSLKHMYSVLIAFTWRPSPEHAAGFWLGGYFCLKRYVIGVVRVCNCLGRVYSDSFLCHLETVIFQYTSRHFKHVF